MILIPELETVLLLVPRTGSGTLRRAVLAKYPNAMQIYRHMEADGVPQGYDRWRRIGVIRHPLERLWSLYKFMRTCDNSANDPSYNASMRASTERPFSDWLMFNDVVFTSPYDSAGLGRFWPGHTMRHPMPENRKSQYVYLRPDLGTEIVRFENLAQLGGELGVWISSSHRHNATEKSQAPGISNNAAEYMQRVFAWDYMAWRNPSYDPPVVKTGPKVSTT